MPRGVGTLLTVKCPAPGTHCISNAWGMPRGGKLVGGGCSWLEFTCTKYTVNIVNK